MKTKDLKTTQPEPRQWGDIEGDFNHVHYTANAVTGLLDSLANQNNANSDSIDKESFCSATYAAHCAVVEMGKHFNELLNVHAELVRSIGKTRPDEIDEIKEIAAEFEDQYPQLRQEADNAVLNGTTLEDFQGVVLRTISQWQNKPQLTTSH